MTVPMTKVGSAPHHELLIAGAEDILIVLPEPGFKDTPDASRATVSALQAYARDHHKTCGLIIIVNNLLAQEAESRRIYAECLTPDLFFGVVLVVNNPFARIIGNLGLRLSAMQIPLTVVETIEAGVAWLEANRNA